MRSLSQKSDSESSIEDLPELIGGFGNLAIEPGTFEDFLSTNERTLPQLELPYPVMYVPSGGAIFNYNIRLVVDILCHDGIWYRGFVVNVCPEGVVIHYGTNCQKPDEYVPLATKRVYYPARGTSFRVLKRQVDVFFALTETSPHGWYPGTFANRERTVVTFHVNGRKQEMPSASLLCRDSSRPRKMADFGYFEELRVDRRPSEIEPPKGHEFEELPLDIMESIFRLLEGYTRLNMRR